jgi:phosphatidylserine/phosphatidylglycerophosphate/cardiolipin synthase-like enzyme
MTIRYQRFQGLFILLITLIFWGIQLTHAAPARFEDRTRFETCFSPKGHCEQKLLFLIQNAKESINIQSYSFTSKQITQALLHAHNRGVSIQMIIDRSLLDPDNYSSRIRPLLKAGIPIWVDDTVSIQHNKVMIIDQRIVETGSYNYTVSANRHNAENMLIIHSVVLAKRYSDNFLQQQQISVKTSEYRYHKPHRRH